MKKLILAFLFVCSIFISTTKAEVLLWQNITNATSGDEKALGVAVDNDNNIIAVGYENVTATDYQWRIMKFDPNGNFLWLNRTNPSIGVDISNGVAVDNSNNIIAVGYDREPGNNQWRIMKFDPNGNLIWWNTTNASSGSDVAYGVAVDSNNNIIVVGQDFVSGSDYQWRIMKFDPNGNLIWWNTTNATSGSEVAYSVTVDNNDNIIVVGHENVTATDYQWRIMKFDPNGNFLWLNRTNPSSGDDRARGVASDGSNIIVVGYDYSPGNNQWRIMKFDPNGNLIWWNTTNASSGDDRAYGVAVDSNNNIIVVGQDFVSGSDYQWRIMVFTTECGDGFYGPWIEECDYTAPTPNAPCPPYAYCNSTCQCHDFRPEMSECNYYDYCINGTNATNPTESCCEQKPLGSGIPIECCLTGGIPSDCSSPFAVRNPNAIAKYDFCWINGYDITDVCIDVDLTDHWWRTCPAF
jgi:uncharacterized delta-60 repeat protein